mmetsp:Transcript_710/g.1535  ORF Transcript_710/g.1535 Transcript_710/m.1535 type:complete len:843 (+) Transcript_710:35-2563(+)
MGCTGAKAPRLPKREPVDVFITATHFEEEDKLLRRLRRKPLPDKDPLAVEWTLRNTNMLKVILPALKGAGFSYTDQRIRQAYLDAEVAPLHDRIEGRIPEASWERYITAAGLVIVMMNTNGYQGELDDSAYGLTVDCAVAVREEIPIVPVYILGTNNRQSIARWKSSFRDAFIDDVAVALDPQKPETFGKRLVAEARDALERTKDLRRKGGPLRLGKRNISDMLDEAAQEKLQPKAGQAAEEDSGDEQDVYRPVGKPVQVAAVMDDQAFNKYHEQRAKQMDLPTAKKVLIQLHASDELAAARNAPRGILKRRGEKPQLEVHKRKWVGGAGEVQEDRARQRVQAFLNAVAMGTEKASVNQVVELASIGDESVAEYSSQVLLQFAQSGAEAQLTELVDHLEALMEVMRRHVDSADTQCSLVGVVHSMLTMKEDAGENQPPRMHRTAKECLDELPRAGGIRRVVEGMAAFPSVLLMQRWGCEVLRLLSVDVADNVYHAEDDLGGEATIAMRSTARRLIIKAGGVELILGLLKVHAESDVAILEHGLATLGLLAASRLEVKQAIGKTGGVKITMNAMAAHADNLAVLEPALTTLKHLAAACVENKERISKRGGIDELVQILNRFTDPVADLPIIRQAIGGLANLSSKHVENKQQLQACGGVEVVVNLLKSTPDSEVACQALACLHNLAAVGDIKKHVVKFGGRELAEEMQKHDDAQVKSMAEVLSRHLAPEETGGEGIFAVRRGPNRGRLPQSRKVRKMREMANKMDEEASDQEDTSVKLGVGFANEADQGGRRVKRQPTGAFELKNPPQEDETEVTDVKVEVADDGGGGKKSEHKTKSRSKKAKS